MDRIAYEPHPVSPERKAELRSQGFRIVDARFAPADSEPKAEGTPSKSDIATMKKADVIEWLEAHGMDSPTGSVADLRDLLRSVMFLDAD
jgi:hypothetical protein